MKCVGRDDYWRIEFEAQADKIMAPIEAFCNLVEQLIEMLEQDKAKYAMEAGNV